MASNFRRSLFVAAARAAIAVSIGSVALAGAAAIAAVPTRDTIDLTAATQLPRTAIPRHYAISVVPNAAKLTFDGTVRIDLEVTKATNTLTLNAANLTLQSASIRAARGGAVVAGTTSIDAAAQTATITFGKTLTPGTYTLDIAYAGKINTQANGLFALDYTDKAGAKKRSLFTQFEAPDARRYY